MQTYLKRLAVVLCLLLSVSLMLFSCADGGAAVSSSLSDSASENTSGGDSAVGQATSEPDNSDTQNDDIWASSDPSPASDATPDQDPSKPASSASSSKAASSASTSSRAASSKAASSVTASSAAPSSKPPSPKPPSSSAASSKAASSKATSSAVSSSKPSSGTEIDYGPRISDDPSQSSDTSFYSSVEDAIFKQLNELRVTQGLHELKKSSSLASGARIRAKEMYDYNYFAHSRPDGGSWDSVFKVEVPLSGYSYLGENLAKTTGMSPSATYFMDLWINSPGHYENMVRSTYTHVGIGVYYGYVSGKGQVAYAVQEFGTFK